jgi:hypothetical protein
MKLENADKPAIKSPFVESEDPAPDAQHDLEKVLGKTPLVQAETTEDKSKDAMDQEAFFNSYTASTQDIGFTPQEIYRRLQEQDQEPNEQDEEILRGLLFDGYYEHTFSIGKIGSFTLRTTSPQLLHVSGQALKEILGDEDTSEFAVRAALLARSVSRINNKPTCSDMSATGFETKEAVVERIRVMMRTPAPLCDMMSDRLNGFINRTLDVARRNISNF